MPRAEADEQAPEKRRYRSPLRDQRAAETKAALLDAARRLFLANGWAKTGMRDVAGEAGVATETLYSYFSSKRALLHAVMDIAVVGDEQPVSVAERPGFAAMGVGSRRDRIRAAASLLAGIQVRTAAFATLLREAAATDGDIAEMLTATRERQRADVEGALRLIIGRPPTSKERDGVWALTSPELYVLLVDVSGWSLDEYEEWMVETLDRMVPPE
jgi:AcrR family transcriptional regulator